MCSRKRERREKEREGKKRERERGKEEREREKGKSEGTECMTNVLTSFQTFEF